MTSWMLDLWFDLQLTYFYFWSTYDFGQRMTRYDIQRLDEWFFAIYEPTSIFIFGQFSVARKLILNGGAIRPIGLLLCFRVVCPSVRPSVCPSFHLSRFRGTTLRAAPSKNYAFSTNYHACIAMPTLPRCAPPILCWPWPPYNLLPRLCLTWIFFRRSSLMGTTLRDIFSSAVPPGSGAFQMPTRLSSSASASVSASASTLRGGRANLRNASVTFSLFWHEASLGWH